MESDAGYKAVNKAMFYATFNAADADKDGLLNWTEFLDFCDKWNMLEKAKYGSHIPMSEDEYATVYDLQNRISPGVEGVSIADYDDKWIPGVMKLMCEIKAECEASK